MSLDARGVQCPIFATVSAGATVVVNTKNSDGTALDMSAWSSMAAYLKNGSYSDGFSRTPSGSSTALTAEFTAAATGQWKVVITPGNLASLEGDTLSYEVSALDANGYRQGLLYGPVNVEGVL